jgi:hypothetical protein
MAMLPLELTLGAFDVDGATIHGEFDIRGNGDRFFAKAGHDRVRGSGFRV